MCALSACAAPLAGSAITQSAGAAPSQFTDPFAYCAVVDTLDEPDARYVGPKVPDTVAVGLRKAMNLPDTAPVQPLVEHSVWRCMARKVFACNFGANLPCTTKANMDQTPTAALNDFCKTKPQSGFIPAVVTGRATVYEWRCANGVAEVARKRTQPDAQGYLSDIWYEIAAP
ncbi:MAG: hypothetical protein LC737_09660 [Chloroflexi bacterium]|nr:hypothetical protein [Chloroflexota bacterium]